jgi:hypothetical protein
VWALVYGCGSQTVPASRFSSTFPPQQCKLQHQQRVQQPACEVSVQARAAVAALMTTTTAATSKYFKRQRQQQRYFSLRPYMQDGALQVTCTAANAATPCWLAACRPMRTDSTGARSAAGCEFVQPCNSSSSCTHFDHLIQSLAVKVISIAPPLAPQLLCC